MNENKIHGKINSNRGIGGKISAYQRIKGDLGNDVNNRISKDYNPLANKPSIEGVELKGDKSLRDFGITYVYQKTTEEWNSTPSLVAEKGAVYIYTDYKHDEKGNDIPGIKLGDGKAYLIDAPFCDQDMQDHINNLIIHITQNEREFWNAKVRCFIDSENTEKLVFTTN